MQDLRIISGGGEGFTSEDLRDLLQFYDSANASMLEALRDEYDFSFPNEGDFVASHQKEAALRMQMLRADTVLGLQIVCEDLEFSEYPDGSSNCLEYLSSQTDSPEKFKQGANSIIECLESRYRVQASPVASILKEFAVSTGMLPAKPVVVGVENKSLPHAPLQQLKKYRNIDFFYNQLAAIRKTLELPDAIAPLDPLPPAINAIPVVGFIDPH